jgi:hypothetical protein
MEEKEKVEMISKDPCKEERALIRHPIGRGYRSIEHKNSNLEIRNCILLRRRRPKPISNDQNLNDRNSAVRHSVSRMKLVCLFLSFEHYGFEFVSDFDIRISDLQT